MESDRRPMDESARRSLGGAARVELTRVARTFGTRAALLPTSLRIDGGEFVSLLGPSGSGKSTLLRMIAGLERPDAGTIEISAGSSCSFVFQDPALLPWRTALANVVLPLELRGEAHARSQERAQEMLSQVGLSDATALYPNQLSGGMRMRVSIARALVSEPSLLLLDEPFAALDERTRFRLQEELRELWLRLRMTTVFVTHSVSEAVFVSDRAVLLSESPGTVLLDRRLSLPERRTKGLRLQGEYLREIERLTEVSR